jgi:transcriptional regulator with XRE-family HTH domain
MTREVMAAVTVRGYRPAVTHAGTTVGPLLRSWRESRRMSQLALADSAEVSTRHLSCVETGRARPSRTFVLHLAEHLDVPLRGRNELLVAAGFAPEYGHTDLDAPEMAPVRDALDLVLGHAEPYPALVVDRHWDLVRANAGLGLLLDGVDPALLEPPVNVLRVSLHPDGLAGRLEDVEAYSAHALAVLRREAALLGDPVLAALHEELAAHHPSARGPTATERPGPVLPLVLRTPWGRLSFLTVAARFGTASDVTLAELTIESFFPADAETAQRVAAATGAAGPPDRPRGP